MIAFIVRLFENPEDLYFILCTGAYALYILFLEERIQQMVTVKESTQSDQHIAPKEKEEDEKGDEEEDAVEVDAVEDEEGEEVDIYLHSFHRVLDRLRRETAAAKY